MAGDGRGRLLLELRQPSDLRVSTSARTRGRAEGGLADLLRSLDASASERVV